jgi:hypothetical protein
MREALGSIPSVSIILCSRSVQIQWRCAALFHGTCTKLTPVGFEPTPLRTGALSQRRRPLGQSVLIDVHFLFRKALRSSRAPNSKAAPSSTKSDRLQINTHRLPPTSPPPPHPTPPYLAPPGPAPEMHGMDSFSASATKSFSASIMRACAMHGSAHLVRIPWLFAPRSLRFLADESRQVNPISLVHVFA